MESMVEVLNYRCALHQMNYFYRNLSYTTLNFIIVYTVSYT